MNILEKIRKESQYVIALGNHTGVIQSVLDFDYLSGKKFPSIGAIVTGGRRAQKYFFGPKEVLVPCYAKLTSIPVLLRNKTQWMLNMNSGRRAHDSTIEFFASCPNALGGHIFAENVPESHATNLITNFAGEKYIFGPSGVGLLVPGHLKLGAIGGISREQLAAGHIMTQGSVAIISTSGGMTNELISAVTAAGRRISFAACIGGDRFSTTSLERLFTTTQDDRQTKAVVYFGELGGIDEYDLVRALASGSLHKPVIAYIAGTVDELFKERVQFGHAKALSGRTEESVRAKREALRTAGAFVPNNYGELIELLAKLPKQSFNDPPLPAAMERRASILSTRQVSALEAPKLLRKSGTFRLSQSFAASALEALLGRPLRSPHSTSFVETAFTLLIDHGGQVSGAVNTMIAARAGKDLVSSLAAGLLTIGPRFGGALNEAAKCWLEAVHNKEPASNFVARKTKSQGHIAGIGHRTYRIGMPDKRVETLAQFVSLLKRHPHYTFAREVEKITTAKNGSLILNIDGAIAALLLDILSECEKIGPNELSELAESEFFNAFFVIPRSVGFIAHFLEQRQNDEGLFRLPDDLLFVRKPKRK